MDSLPYGPEWECIEIEIEGDNGKKEHLDLWKRDPVECVAKLIGNRSFREHLHYAPERIWKDRVGGTRIYEEMWNGDLWWQLQVAFLSVSL